MADVLWYGFWVLAASWLILSDITRQPTLRDLVTRAKAR
jgi:hypothetical protein